MSQWVAIQDSSAIVLGWRLTSSEFTITIRSTPEGEGWTATCHAIDMDAKLLAATSHVAAKREAVRDVVSVIRRMAAEAERVFVRHGQVRMAEVKP